VDRDTRNALIAAAWIMLLFGLAAYWLPTVMLAVGSVSTILAGIVAAIFLVAFFAVFWLRARSQRNKGR
jgi:apolipoprotein N-acyltransferase